MPIGKVVGTSHDMSDGQVLPFRAEKPNQPRPASVYSFQLPRRDPYFPSPADWRDEVIYFLLPDRFSDGLEGSRPLLNRSNPAAGRGPGFRFDQWAQSGGDRWQGGTINGVRSQLDYLQGLGITTIWLGPVLKQRAHLDTFHGYAIQDFLEVDPRFGTRRDLVDLVTAAHDHGLRVILDIVFNHSGSNWIYANGQTQPPYLAFPQFYSKGAWYDADGNPTNQIGPTDADTGAWPLELQKDDYYTRAGGVDFGGSLDDPHAPFRRTDFFDLRDFNYDGSDLLDVLARCYKYWIALTDCDGFRLDTLKHVSEETGRNFCGTIKEFAANLGKADFFLVGEVAGSDGDAARYREVLGRNLNSTLDIGGIRRILHSVAKGLIPPDSYFTMAQAWDPVMGSHRDSGELHVTILDDHDHVSGEKVRFSTDAASAWQVTAGVAIQLFSLGIPCIYYGTEQSFAGPEKSLRDQFLPDFNANTGTDKYLREAMFGPENPLRHGRGGIGLRPTTLDLQLPGFGPFGTSGAHCFDPHSPAYVRISVLLAVRKKYPVLRVGRQYQRPISNFQSPFSLPGGGELIAWSRILDDEEALCVVNGHGVEARGGDVIIDSGLNRGAGSFLAVIANTQQTANPGIAVDHPIGQQLPVKTRNGVSYVEVRNLGPSETLVLVNRP